MPFITGWQKIGLNKPGKNKFFVFQQLVYRVGELKVILNKNFTVGAQSFRRVSQSFLRVPLRPGGKSIPLKHYWRI